MFMREHGKRQLRSPKIGTDHEIDLKRDFPCQNCGRTIYIGLADGKAHNRDGTFHSCGLAELEPLSNTGVFDNERGH
jgi:hypothetical protein